MSKDVLTKEEQFLLQEYNIRSNQMIHEDKLRNQLITFIITLSTAIIGGIVYLLKNYCFSQLIAIIVIINVAFFCLILISIIIIAKIRKAQLQWMIICNNIREYFYNQNYLYYNINILSRNTFPTYDFRKPCQTILFVYLLSIFNSLLIINKSNYNFF